VIYGNPEQDSQTADTVLFTHHRRDVVWAGRTLVENGARSVVPAREAEQFTQVERFWSNFWDRRYHDYTQQSTRILATPLRVDQTVQEGTELPWQDLKVHVLDTPPAARCPILSRSTAANTVLWAI
jgi:glyoxylase-like metal-dependent hydrolase (beta-lactamase superfamily II)